MGDAAVASATAPASDRGSGATGEIPEATPMTDVTATGAATTTDAPGGTTNTATKLNASSVGEAIPASLYDVAVTTHDNQSVTFKQLLDDSKSGVVIFTYPKASTPGCTTQACLFRDSYAPITGAGLSVFGLSTDSEKANTGFVNKHGLPYALLCDAKAGLTGGIGM